MEFIRTGSDSAEEYARNERTAFTTDNGSNASPDFFNDATIAFNNTDRDNQIKGKDFFPEL